MNEGQERLVAAQLIWMVNADRTAVAMVLRAPARPDVVLLTLNSTLVDTDEDVLDRAVSLVLDALRKHGPVTYLGRDTGVTPGTLGEA